MEMFPWDRCLEPSVNVGSPVNTCFLRTDICRCASLFDSMYQFVPVTISYLEVCVILWLPVHHNFVRRGTWRTVSLFIIFASLSVTTRQVFGDASLAYLITCAKLLREDTYLELCHYFIICGHRFESTDIWSCASVSECQCPSIIRSYSCTLSPEHLRQSATRQQ